MRDEPAGERARRTELEARPRVWAQRGLPSPVRVTIFRLPRLTAGRLDLGVSATLGALDVLAAAAVVAVQVPAMLGVLRRPAVNSPTGRVLVVLDGTCSLNVLRARRAEHSVTHRDLDGYFDHVWTVHPLVGASPEEPEESSTGPPAFTRLGDRHTVIEGPVSRFARLRRFPVLNFALAQTRLMRVVSQLILAQGVGAIAAADPFYTGLVALGLGRAHGVPVEIRINGNYDAIYEEVGTLAYPKLLPWRWLERAVGRFTLSRAAQVVVGSANNREYALRNGARIDRVVDCGNWSMINPVHLGEPRERAPVADELDLGHRPYAVAVCRLERLKHPEDVLEALALARAGCPELGGLLIGDGTMRRELERRACELDLDGHLVFAGDRDQRWVCRALAGAAVVLAPLAGLALVEAALSGTPIVAYDVEWHSEVIDSETTGILVPYRSTEAMSAAVRALLADPQRASRLGAAARSRVLVEMRADDVLARERALAEILLTSGGRAL